MLVLTRKQDESIILGQNIEIKVLGIEEGKVKLGIDAPRDVEIHRKEVYIQIQEENRAASLPPKEIGSIHVKELFRKLDNRNQK